MNGDNSERIPQEGECREAGKYGILDEASAVAQRVLEEIEALAGTTACKSVQLLRLSPSKFTRDSRCTVSEPSYARLSDIGPWECLSDVCPHLLGRTPFVWVVHFALGLLQLCFQFKNGMGQTEIVTTKFVIRVVCNVNKGIVHTRKGRFFAERSGRAERLLCTFCFNGSTIKNIWTPALIGTHRC